MPIYEYRCEHCGFEKEYLQKVSDPPVVQCPSCGEPAMKKKLTAAGFQLKGTGWYVTDFRNKDSGKPADKKNRAQAEGGDGTSSKSDTGTDAKTEAKGDSKTGTTESKSDKPADSKTSSSTSTDSTSSSKPATGS